MIAVLFIFIATLAGFCITKSFFSKISSLEQLAVGWIVGLTGSTVVAFISVALVGYPWGMISVLGALTALSWQCFPIKLRRFKWSSHYVPLLGFLVFWNIIFIALFNHHMLRSTPEGWRTGVNSYGDLALHSTYIHYFAEQSKFSMISPMYAQQTIRYPFLINFHTALLVRNGLPLYTALVLTSILTINSILVLLYYFCLNITGKYLTPYLASLLYFFNGGSGIFYLFKDWRASKLSLFNFLANLPKDYTNLPELQIYWSNVITTHLLPQRGFLVGLACLMVFLRLWQIVWYQKKVSINQLFFISFLVALTPLFHIHTFLLISPVFVWLLIWSWRTKKITVNQALLLAFPALALGIFQLLYLVPPEPSATFLRLQLGWKAEGQWLSFWLKNMGLESGLLVLSTVGFWLVGKKNSYEKLLILPFTAVFIICNIFIFQPFDWDNMKFFLLSFLATAILSAAVLTHWKNRVVNLGVLLVVISASASGAVGVLYSSQVDWQLATAKDLKLAEVVKNKTPSDAVFLTGDIHNHPIPMIAGRAVVRGYRGWLWTHGIDYTKTDADIVAIYAGTSQAKSLIDAYHIEYIFVGPAERKEYLINEAFFKNQFPIMYEDESSVIFQVKKN